MKKENYKRIMFGTLIFIAGIILTIAGHNILGLSGGLIGLYFVFTK